MDAQGKGVNNVDFYLSADRPYLVITSDDKTFRTWDYLSKGRVRTLESHTNSILFHPNLPIIISGEDGTIKIWYSDTYRLENILSYSPECALRVALRRNAGGVVIEKVCLLPRYLQWERRIYADAQG